MATAVMLVLTALATLRCATSSGSWMWVDDYAQKAPSAHVHHLQVGDRVSLLVWNQPQLSGEHVVRGDGLITVPLMGDIPVVGLTTAEAAARVDKGLSGLVREPQTTLALVAPRQAVVFVVGEVRTPGEFPLTRDEGVLELLARAGGLTEFADRERIFVIRKSPERSRIRFSYERLREGTAAAVGFRLRDGDVLVVE